MVGLAGEGTSPPESGLQKGHLLEGAAQEKLAGERMRQLWRGESVRQPTKCRGWAWEEAGEGLCIDQS